MMHIDRQTIFFPVSVSLFSLTACFLLFLPSVSLLLARMTTIIISTLSLSLCSIKGYEKNLYDHSSIVSLHSFLTFARLQSLLYTQLTITKTAAVVIIVAGPIIIGN
jgi:hypothetical protein